MPRPGFEPGAYSLGGGSGAKTAGYSPGTKVLQFGGFRRFGVPAKTRSMPNLMYPSRTPVGAVSGGGSTRELFNRAAGLCLLAPSDRLEFKQLPLALDVRAAPRVGECFAAQAVGSSWPLASLLPA